MFLSRFGNMTVVDEPVYKSELVYGLGYMAGYYSQIANSTNITNTIVETSLIGTGVGTLAVPANNFLQGNAYVVKMGGIISANNGDTITINLKANGGTVILASTGAINLKGTTNNRWQLDVQFVIRQIGVAGVAAIQTFFVFSYEEDASDNFESHTINVTNTTTFNTTILNTLDITAKWGAASVSDSIYSTVFNLNKIF